MDHVTISDPESPHDMPVYDGPAAEAYRVLEPGRYAIDGGGAVLVVTDSSAAVEPV